MDYDEPPSEPKHYPPSPARMSKTPSWIMLGFVLGALFVLLFPRMKEPVTPPRSAPPPLAKTEPEQPREPAPLTRIEAVFADWGKNASWDDDVTEVALWNSTTNGFDDYYEVRRAGGNYYFRTIAKLTRRVITYRSQPADCPLQFTESEDDYQWRTRRRAERPPPTYTPPPRGAPVTAPAPPAAPKMVPQPVAPDTVVPREPAPQPQP